MIKTKDKKILGSAIIIVVAIILIGIVVFIINNSPETGKDNDKVNLDIDSGVKNIGMVNGSEVSEKITASNNISNSYMGGGGDSGSNTGDGGSDGGDKEYKTTANCRLDVAACCLINESLETVSDSCSCINEFNGSIYYYDSCIAESSCFVRLRLNEAKNEGNFSYSFIKATSLYGEYEASVNYYDLSSEYEVSLLNLLDENMSLINSFYYISPRFILADFVTENESIQETENASQDIIVPFYNETRYIAINDTLKITVFDIFSYNLTCEKTCKEENETLLIGEQKCCGEFIPSQQKDSSYVCTNCGDGICSESESFYSCQSDCPTREKQVVNETVSLSPEGPVKENWLMFIFVAILLIIVFVALILMKRKKK